VHTSAWQPAQFLKQKKALANTSLGFPGKDKVNPEKIKSKMLDYGRNHTDVRIFKKDCCGKLLADISFLSERVQERLPPHARKLIS